MAEEWGLFINGQEMTTKNKIEVTNKYTGDIIATVSKAGEQEVDQAIASAKEAHELRGLSPYERYEVLLNASRLLQEQKEDFAETIMREAGKPITQARTEVDRAIQTFTWSAEEAKRIAGQAVPVNGAPGSENRLAFTVRVPVGVVAAIGPFNFPLNLIAHKIGPALAAGNGVVLKPASATPLSSLKLAQLFAEAGLPNGLLNVVVGAGSVVGEQLQKDERISVYTFTGSAEVGLKIKQNTGLNKLILELGSNAPVIVDREADLSKAAKQIAMSAFAFAGQVCISAQRVYVHQAVFKNFQNELLAETKKLPVGSPLDEATVVGPMISEEAAKRAEDWVQEAVKQGAQLLTGGERTGAIMTPAVLADVDSNMKVVKDEVFAPVISLIEYADMDACIEEVNKSRYGLQGSIFTKNMDIAFHAARSVEVGGMMINDAPSYRVDQMPYGGVKDSGWGKEGPKYAIEDMTNERLIVMNLE